MTKGALTPTSSNNRKAHIWSKCSSRSTPTTAIKATPKATSQGKKAKVPTPNSPANSPKDNCKSENGSGLIPSLKESVPVPEAGIQPRFQEPLSSSLEDITSQAKPKDTLISTIPTFSMSTLISSLNPKYPELLPLQDTHTLQFSLAQKSSFLEEGEPKAKSSETFMRSTLWPWLGSKVQKVSDRPLRDTAIQLL